MRFTNTVEIKRPVPEVFSYLADFRNIPRWNHAVADSTPSAGPTSVGTTIRQTRTLPTRSVESLEVTAFEADRRIELTGTLGPFAGVMTYQLEQLRDGTRLTNSADLRPSGLAAVAAPLYGGRIRDAVAQNLRVLKGLLEDR